MVREAMDQGRLELVNGKRSHGPREVGASEW